MLKNGALIALGCNLILRFGGISFQESDIKIVRLRVAMYNALPLLPAKGWPVSAAQGPSD